MSWMYVLTIVPFLIVQRHSLRVPLVEGHQHTGRRVGGGFLHLLRCIGGCRCLHTQVDTLQRQKARQASSLAVTV